MGVCFQILTDPLNDNTATTFTFNRLRKNYDERIGIYSGFCAQEVNKSLTMAYDDHVRLVITYERGEYKVEIFLADCPRKSPWAAFTCSIWKEDPMNG